MAGAVHVSYRRLPPLASFNAKYWLSHLLLADAAFQMPATARAFLAAHRGADMMLASIRRHTRGQALPATPRLHATMLQEYLHCL